MINRLISFWQKIDWVLLTTILLLAFFGLAAIYSVALGQGRGEFFNFQKQIVWLLIGLVVMFIAANIDYRFWKKISWPGYILSIVLLIAVLTPLGSTIRGTRGWFVVGSVNFQPVELIKIFMIMVLAGAYSYGARSISKLRHLFLISLVMILPLIAVVVQPDFGSAMILFFVWLISFILVSKNKKHFFMIAISILLALAVSWMFLFQDYQKDRIRTFLDPSLDPLGSGYNVSQSLIAVGAGRTFGRGLGFGSQSQLKFIPESQTDFIFAVIAEELGFVGVLILLSLFLIMFWRLFYIAQRAPDDFGMFVVILVAILIFVHIIINIGMGMGLLPVTGISLPLVSYGGSFLVIILFLFGVCFNVYKNGLVFKK
jgi:rod shape determining protein RodA